MLENQGPFYQSLEAARDEDDDGCLLAEAVEEAALVEIISNKKALQQKRVRSKQKEENEGVS